MPSSPFVFFAGARLSEAELSAARLDGHLVPLGDAYVPADTIETAALRAATLGDLLGTTLAATHVTAAWIHGAVVDPPARRMVQRAVHRRTNPIIDVRTVYRDMTVDIDDLVLLGGVWVTSVTRTLVDLVRVRDDLHQSAARAVIEHYPHEVDEAVSWFDRHPRTRNRRTGLGVLERLRHDDVTR